MDSFTKQLKSLHPTTIINFSCIAHFKPSEYTELNVPGVYFLVLEKAFGRVVGSSNVLYIGCSGMKKNQNQGMLGRLRNTRSKKYGVILSHIQKASTCMKIKVILYQSENPLEIEKLLLSSYLETYFELPPLNSHLPSK